MSAPFLFTALPGPKEQHSIQYPPGKPARGLPFQHGLERELWYSEAPVIRQWDMKTRHRGRCAGRGNRISRKTSVAGIGDARFVFASGCSE